MTAEKIRELELRISEAIEPKPRELFDYAPIMDTCSDGRAWECKRGQFVVTPRPWTTDESASAMLLDMMPEVTLRNRPRLGGWMCRSNDDTFSIINSDRKLVIALAFKAWKQSELEKEQR